jgi:hypothetical protein
VKFYITILAVSLIAMVSCKKDTVVATPHPVKDTAQKPVIQEDPEPQHYVSYENMHGTIGIITTSESYRANDIIPVYDSLKNRISEIMVGDEKQVLDLRCLKKEGLYYKVKLEDGTIGYMANNPEQVVFHTWEEHLLNTFSVDFDPEKNPLRQGPSASAATGIPYTQDNFYHPHKVQGDWLQVSYGYDDDTKYAWIKWKENNRLLVEFYYFA